jgi:alkanesulfonate monooxygenase SsuD/methylene tetrahydromethanopterin reductase-like flavin-dependent oxidoreductase (luciferase family)
MKISITVEGFGLAWDRWKDLIVALKGYGFASIFKSDHFHLPNPPYGDHLEVYVALTYLASHLPDVDFGTLVSPLSFRDPVMLARQAMAIDDLSDGRMILGVGSGWMQSEHDMFGYTLGTVKERLDRFEEALEVMTHLIRSDEPLNFDGQYYQLQDAILLPRPQRKTPILIGGDGPKRTMPLVARYADIWNCQGTLDNFKAKSALLDDLLLAEGRQIHDVTRTHTVGLGCWQSEADRDQIVADVPESTLTHWGSKDKFIESMQNEPFGNSPAGVVQKLKAFEEAGCEEIMFHYFGMKGNTQLDILAEHVLPHFE